MKFISLFLIFISGCFSCSHLPPVEQKTDPVKDAYQSVGRLSAVSKDGKGSIFATGFAINDDYIISVAHFCVSAFEGSVKGELEEKINIMFVYHKEVIELKQVLKIELIEEKTDVCILRGNPGLTPVKFANYSTVSIGNKVYAVGSPLSLFPQYSEGRVNLPRMDIKRDGREVLFMSLFVSPGNSGSPVFDDRGKVIGMILACVVPNVFMTASSPFALAQRGDVLQKFVKMMEED